MVGIIDYNTGNLKSVENALARLQAEYTISSNPDILRCCDRIILPGVGDARWAMENLRETGLDRLVKSLTQPVLGICLGMQLLCSHSEESDTECLGIFRNRVRYLRNENGRAGDRIKIPHIGWNTLEQIQSSLFNGLENDPYVYFVHSYCADINENTVSVTEYGGRFSSSIQKENFAGCQFHPEKSGETGEKILKNFLTSKIIKL